MPTLRCTEVTLDLRCSTHILTHAQSPPKVLTIPGEVYEDLSVDPFHPLDYTTNHKRSTADLGILAQAAAAEVAINNADVDDLSCSSQAEQRTVGEKGGLVSDDKLYNSNRKNPTYNLPEDFDDNDLFYLEDEDLDAALDRGLDDIARAIEYSNPKKTNHRCHPMTTIVGGPIPPDYTGMDDQEKVNAKATYKVQRKAYVDKIL